MGEIVFGISVFAWLFSGGWALAHLARGEDRDTVVGLFFMCLLFAPLTAGFAYAEKSAEEQP